MDIISLFSGAGGMDLGFVQAGHRIVWANDHDHDAVETYKQNIGQHIHEGDIEGVDLSRLPNADMVIGGFPCQGFSCANLKRSTNDTRNELYLEFLRVLVEKEPRFFLAENVRGILSLDNGRVISMIVRDFEKCGYKVNFEKFNLADYGIPQTRNRVIIVGVREDISDSVLYQFPKPTHSKKMNTGLRPWVTISEALKNIPEPEESHNFLNHVCSQYKITNRNFTGHRKTDPNKPSPTILARGNGKGGVCAIQHPNNHRRLSVRESAVIQTFPLEFEFFGRMNSMYRQVGNAVPIEFARVLGEEFTRIDINSLSHDEILVA
jgi:DNA (cytosine-5)-methyltransferase 1